MLGLLNCLVLESELSVSGRGSQRSIHDLVHIASSYIAAVSDLCLMHAVQANGTVGTGSAGSGLTIGIHSSFQGW